jgi:hypothetical protein
VNLLIIKDNQLRFQLLPLASGSVREAFPNRKIGRAVAAAFAENHSKTKVVDLGKNAKAALAAVRNFIFKSFAPAVFLDDDLETYLCAFVLEVHGDDEVWRKVRPFVVLPEQLKLFEDEAFVRRLKRLPGLVLDSTFLQRLDSLHVLALHYKAMKYVADERVIGKIFLPKFEGKLFDLDKPGHLLPG